MITLKEMRRAMILEGLVPSEYLEDKKYINNMIIPNYDLSDILFEISDFTYFYDLSQGNDYWNEIRHYNNETKIYSIVDSDAPSDLTAKEWTEYLNKLIK